MAVDAVFISSIISGFEDVRDAAAAAVSASGLHPIRSEKLSADPASSRRALLDQIAGAEYYLLLLGSRYGDPGANGMSPTEEEYEEAVRLGKPVLVLVQTEELEDCQREFLERIRGNWGEGVFYGTFSGASDIGARVADALIRQRSQIVDDAPAAREKAIHLVAKRNGWSGSVAVRAAFVPLRQTTLLGAIELEDEKLVDDLISAMRTGGSISQSAGVTGQVSASGILLGPAPQQSGPQAEVGADGSIGIAGSAAAEGTLGGMQIDPTRLSTFIAAAGRSAQLIWDRIDLSSEVGQVAVTAAVHDAQYLAYGGSSGGALSLGGSVPQTVIAPDPPVVAPRAQLDKDTVSRQILAAIKRVFADAGRVQ
jgi:hypothetical protein